MNAEQLFDNIGQIDDLFITQANSAPRRVWPKFVLGLASCFVFAVVLYIALPQRNEPLPMLTVTIESNSAGVGGFLEYDIQELSNGNPWTEHARITRLPVIQNPVTYDSTYQLSQGLSEDTMNQIARQTALDYGLQLLSLTTHPTQEELTKTREKFDSAGDSTPVNTVAYQVVAECSGGTIEVAVDGKIRIFFDPGIPLQNMNFSLNLPRKETQQVLTSLLKLYTPFTQIKKPAFDLMGTYSYSGEHKYYPGAYESSGSLVDRILNYNFHLITFAPNEEGELWIINLPYSQPLQTIGQYPIISAKEARSLLLDESNGKYHTGNTPSEEQIVKVELIYKADLYSEAFMPYYRFYIEQPERKRDNGLRHFALAYVPAVESQYLNALPVSDSRFN